MQKGTIVLVFEKGARGRTTSLTTATVRDVSDDGKEVVLFDGRRFVQDRKDPSHYYNHDLRYKTFMRAPFGYENPAYLDWVREELGI